ncbi:hypothetical protein SUGI_0025750 [Cryptomeria japonica]|nr:hypothetical protein SUGI_0025750 [Cryptomeria japonica]
MPASSSLLWQQSSYPFGENMAENRGLAATASTASPSFPQVSVQQELSKMAEDREVYSIGEVGAFFMLRSQFPRASSLWRARRLYIS